jgi:hypothetical protein
VAALLSEELGRPITTADRGWDGDIEAVSAISGLILPLDRGRKLAGGPDGGRGWEAWTDGFW